MKACLGMIMYITNICNKVNSTCAFLQKNLGKCTSTIKSHMNMSDQQFSGYVPLLFGHPMLKYVDMSRLEMAQRNVSDFAFNDFSSYMP